MEKIFKALSCKWRISIVEMLLQGETCQCEIVKSLPLDLTTLSRHISVLKNAGLVIERREGTRKFLSLKNPEMVREILELAGRLENESS